jgi:hypothetical protein
VWWHGGTGNKKIGRKNIFFSPLRLGGKKLFSASNRNQRSVGEDSQWNARFMTTILLRLGLT